MKMTFTDFYAQFDLEKLNGMEIQLGEDESNQVEIKKGVKADITRVSEDIEEYLKDQILPLLPVSKKTTKGIKKLKYSAGQYLRFLRLQRSARAILSMFLAFLD